MEQQSPDRLSAADAEIIGALTEFRDALQSKTPIEKKFTVRTVELTLNPGEYNAEEVKRTRKLLNLSQAIFAQLLGVSVKTVRGWERGLKPPAPIACRFMDEINISPEHWRARLKQIYRSNDTQTV